MKILLALDDSKCSEAATDTVAAQFVPGNAEVQLLHALEPYPAILAEEIGGKDSPDFVAARTHQRKLAEEFLGKAAKKLRAAGFKVDSCVHEGDPRTVILDHAEKLHIDLIVAGSHGRKGIDRFLMGSVSKAVAEYARCSVLVVRTRSAGTKKK
jgi:nucleotide-binding universal stress UspA family protein